MARRRGRLTRRMRLTRSTAMVALMPALTTFSLVLVALAAYVAGRGGLP